MQNKRTLTPDACRVLIIVLWVGAAGVFIRIWGLWNYAFNPDEAMLSCVAAADSFSALWEGIKAQTNAPLMYVILHLLIMLGKNELLLRCVSLIPGACLIIAFYFLGKKVSGAVSGITMAFLCAFGYGAVQLSQVVRPYSLLLVFLSGALYFFAAGLEKPVKKNLFGYSLCMLLAVATHYSSVILCAAAGCVWFLRPIIGRRPSAEYRSVIMAHLLPLALFCILYFYHISYHLGGGGVYGAIKETYLAPLFPDTFRGFLNNTRDFFGYLFLPPYADLAACLSLLGAVALWQSCRRTLAAVIVLTLAGTILLNIFRLFPFGGSRHSIYLFPLVCVLVGASAQYGFDAARRQIEKYFSPLTSEQARSVIGWALVLMVILSAGAVTFTMRKCDFLRRYRGPGEFLVTRSDYNRIMGYLIHNGDRRTAIVTNLQTYYYFAFLNHVEEMYVALGFFKFTWKGLNGYLVFVWQFDTLEIINAALQALKEHAALTTVSTIYFVNMGWDTGLIETVRSANPLYKTVFKERLLLEGGYLYSLSPQAVLREIGAGRFRNNPAPAVRPDIPK